MKLFIPIILSILIFSCENRQTDKINVFVSIQPQKYFVEKIGGDKVNVFVMVRPGHSPSHYEPLPDQIVKLSQTELYFSIDVPFEKVLLNKIQSNSSEIKVYNCAKDIRKKEFKSFGELFVQNEEVNDIHADEKHYAEDPHIWLSPMLVKTMSKNILESLIEYDKSNENFYKTNYDEFVIELDSLNNYITRMFNKLGSRKFFVFHPAWGYFADQYGLEQIPIEVEGKEPTPSQLIPIIEYAKRENIKSIFVQSQNSRAIAQVIAKEIKGYVVQIDPLAENYIENMKNIASIISVNINN